MSKTTCNHCRSSDKDGKNKGISQVNLLFYLSYLTCKGMAGFWDY